MSSPHSRKADSFDLDSPDELGIHGPGHLRHTQKIGVYMSPNRVVSPLASSVPPKPLYESNSMIGLFACHARLNTHTH